MDCWGTQCPHDHGEVRRVISCINSTPCPPQNCTGSWVSNGPCNGTCGGGAGIQPERYAITTPANYSGTECPESDGATRAIMPCNNTTPCPIDCVGHWSILTGNCTGHCQGGQGFVPEVFNVTVAAAHGGKACNFSHGTYRYVINCTNNIPCPPRNCQGQWVDDGDCIGGCGPRSNALRGLMPERFIITITAAYGGQNCTNAAGDTQLTKSCLNELFPPCVNIPCNATCRLPRSTRLCLLLFIWIMCILLHSKQSTLKTQRCTYCVVHTACTCLYVASRTTLSMQYCRVLTTMIERVLCMCDCLQVTETSLLEYVTCRGDKWCVQWHMWRWSWYAAPKISHLHTPPR